MAYYPIITTGADPFTDGFFTLAGNQTSAFSVGDRLIAYDTYSSGSPAVLSSAIYVFTVGNSSGSPTIAGTYFDGANTRVYVDENIPNIAASGRAWVQATDGEYVIAYADASKVPLTIQPAAMNSDTDISLPGRGVLHYGEFINTALLHLLENFAGPVPPGSGSPDQQSPIEGQLWYDTSTPAAPIIRVWNATSLNWDTFEGSGQESDDEKGDGTANVVTTNVPVQTKTSVLSFQQVFLNGVLQREATDAADMTGSPTGGNYYVSAANTLTFAFTLTTTDEVVVYKL